MMTKSWSKGDKEGGGKLIENPDHLNLERAIWIVALLKIIAQSWSSNSFYDVEEGLVLMGLNDELR